MSAGVDEKPHIVRAWVPRKGRFVYHALPVVISGWQQRLSQKHEELNRSARNWCAAQNQKVK